MCRLLICTPHWPLYGSDTTSKRQKIDSNHPFHGQKTPGTYSQCPSSRVSFAWVFFPRSYLLLRFLLLFFLYLEVAQRASPWSWTYTVKSKHMQRSYEKPIVSVVFSISIPCPPVAQNAFSWFVLTVGNSLKATYRHPQGLSGTNEPFQLFTWTFYRGHLTRCERCNFKFTFCIVYAQL